MTMTKTLRQMNIFIASPGDVSDARDRVRKAVERVNRLVAKRSGFLLEPIGWEDIPASKAKRTQDLLNPYVDAADIFIGILNKRFGSPTGVAESGTVEEYNRIEKRWFEEDPKPQIMIYFKRLLQEDLTDPGEQLQRVLEFKKRISDTVLYKEFEGSDDLGEKIEEGLADWIHQQRDFTDLAVSGTDVDTIESIDLDILICLAQNEDMSIATLQDLTSHSAEKIDMSLARLERHALIAKQHGKIELSNSTEGFLSIVKHLISSNQWRSLLQSDYYNRMLDAKISNLIEVRFHCKIEKEIADLLRKLALLSPTAASYVLFGDTSLYDNLSEHARTLGEQHVTMANDMMKRNILHHVLLRYAEDSTNDKTLATLEGRTIAGQIVTLKIAAAYDDGLAFDAFSMAPLVRARAATDLKKGQMVFGSPGLFVQTGTIYMHMGEFDLAVEEFDRVLTRDNPSKVRAAALNNKGLIRLRQQQVQEAIELFREAAEIDPELTEPKKNLERAQSLLISDAAHH